MAAFRTLDPALGRWWSVDPAIESYMGLSPYNSMLNNPIAFNDPYGDNPLIIAGALIGAGVNLWQNRHNIDSPLDFIVAAGIGAGAGALAAIGMPAAAVGSTFGATIGSYAASGAIAGGIGGAAQGFGNGVYFHDGNIGDRLANGFVDGLTGLGTGVVFGAATGVVFGAGAHILSKVRPTVPAVKIPEEIVDQKVIEAAVKTGRMSNRFPDGKIYVQNESGNWVLYSSSNKPVPYYPPNCGALGSWTRTTLKPGQIIDRFGSDYGKYFSPANTPLSARALPPGNTGQLSRFEVLKSFDMQQSVIAPAFGKPGGGIQYFSKFLNVKELIQGAYIRKIP